MQEMERLKKKKTSATAKHECLTSHRLETVSKQTGLWPCNLKRSRRHYFEGAPLLPKVWKLFFFFQNCFFCLILLIPMLFQFILERTRQPVWMRGYILLHVWLQDCSVDNCACLFCADWIECWQPWGCLHFLLLLNVPGQQLNVYWALEQGPQLLTAQLHARTTSCLISCIQFTANTFQWNVLENPVFMTKDIGSFCKTNKSKV